MGAGAGAADTMGSGVKATGSGARGAAWGASTGAAARVGRRTVKTRPLIFWGSR
ncbi:hypothetical protein D3C72_2325140 [compost metagenome]